MMRRQTTLRLDLTILTLVVAVAGLFIGGPAARAGGPGVVVTLDSVTLPVGSSGSVELKALNIPEPGLGSWSININYSPEVVSVVSCSAEQGGVCDPHRGPSTVHISGGSANGVPGDVGLGFIEFKCLEFGSSPLVLGVEVFDTTTGKPQTIESTEEGKVSCPVLDPPPPPTAGDANCTGRVDGIDAALVLQLSAGLIGSVPCQNAADVNGDGRPDSIDAALILQYSAGLLHSLPT